MKLSWFTDSELWGNLIATGLLALGVLVARALVLRAVDRAKVGSEAGRLRTRVLARNLGFALFLLGSTFIWASQIQSFALSMVAIAAALVLATKELILCVSGAVLRASSGAYSVGDRVEIGSVRGDVIDIAMLSTTLLEVGPGHQRTGRAITVPNSRLLTDPVVNETFMDEYVLHVVRVPIDPRVSDFEEAERVLLEVGREVSEEHVEPAREFMDALSRRHGLPNLSVEPRVQLSVTSPSEVLLLLRLPAPVRERGRVEQAVLRGYLTGMQDLEHESA